MLKFIDSVLCQFRPCFSRSAAFEWFAVVVLGLMIRSDYLGITSIIRDLSLNPCCYECLNHFFRSAAWSLEGLLSTWVNVVRNHAPVYRVDGAAVLIGDGIKVPKEGRRMPAVQKLHQESENSSKAPYIFGHLLGAVGVLVGGPTKLSCLPLHLQLQAGVKTIFSWAEGESQRQESHVVQLLQQAYEAGKSFGKTLLLLDRYFLSVHVLRCLQLLNQAGAKMNIITRAKRSCIAYEKPSYKPGKGRPRKKGAKLKLFELFSDRAEHFKEVAVTLYGKREKVRYLCLDLMWGQGLYQELRFVLVKYNGRYAILVSTDLTLAATTIIELYGLRFKIESMFRALKHSLGGLAYQFWSKSMPKLKRYLKKDEVPPLEQISDKKDKQNILQTIKATEGYVTCCCIAMGILQMLALRYSSSGLPRPFRYLRTRSRGIVSEATIMDYLRKSIFRMFAKNSQLTITQIIKSKQLNCNSDEDLLVP